MHKYRQLTERIHVPEGLDERVLAAARKKGRESGQGQIILRRAVCAACALVLVLGSVSLRRGNTPGAVTSGEGVGILVGTPALHYTFGIMAGAVENAVNGGLIFRWENDCGSFRISGKDIAEVSLETSKGVLLRDGREMGSSIKETFDPETVYSLAAAAGEDVEALDNVELTLTVTFTDGTVKTEAYFLRAEKLRVFFNEDGSEVLVPSLEGDSSGTVPALYGESMDSRWLSWPVADSKTVSLSRSFGITARQTGGEGVFHAGIDIPGAQGMRIAAAAPGTVTETGFSAQRGNYLVVDHGDGLTTLYGQCQELLANEGDHVEAGQDIALLGSTGMSTGPHLHFEVRQDGEAQNPVAYFTRTVRDTLCAK